jgi:hypothetical protein
MWKIPNFYFYGKDKINNIGEKKSFFHDHSISQKIVSKDGN